MASITDGPKPSGVSAAHEYPANLDEPEASADESSYRAHLEQLDEVLSGDRSARTEDALALKLGRSMQARHVAPWGRWLLWDGVRWVIDEKLEHMTRAREMLRREAMELQQWAERETQKRTESEGSKFEQSIKRRCRYLLKNTTVAAVVSLARSNPAQAASVKQWDCDPWLLGTPSGTVDLRTGATRDPDTRDYITKLAAVAPAAKGTPTPLWDAFLHQAMQGDEELIAYLQRFAGYALTGSVREHAFVFGYGSGANGKGVFTGALQGALGDYAITVPTDVLMVSRTERHPTELARLRGVRLAIGSEIEVGRMWAESRIKALTGGDRIAARLMRQDFFEFDPRFKLFVVGNHKPSLRCVDEAIRRRLHLVPFAVTIPPRDRDPALPQKLRAEWPGILRWAIEGCVKWREAGLDPPESVRVATSEYLANEDAMERWTQERSERDPNAGELAKHLYADWKHWADDNGEFKTSQKRFSQDLAEKGFDSVHTNAGNRWLGLRLRYPPSDASK